MPLSQLRQLLTANGFGTQTIRLSPGFYKTVFVSPLEISIYALEGFGFSIGLTDSPQRKALVELIERTSAIADSKVNKLKIASVGLEWDRYLNLEYPILNSLNTSLSLVKALELLNDKIALIPAQLIYLYQRSKHNEPKLGLSSSVGSGANFSRQLAIERAICEVVEWDSFITHFLVEGPIRRLKLPQKTSLGKQKIETAVFEITNDIKIPSFLALIVNPKTRTLSFGLRAGFNVNQVIRGAITEAQANYLWLELESAPTVSNRLKLANTLKRSFYRSGAAVKLFKRYLRTPPNYTLPQYPKLSAEKELNQLLECLRQKLNLAYLFEYENKYLELAGLTAVKVVIPHLRPIDTRSRKTIEERITRLNEVASFFGVESIKIRQPAFPLF